ncbi:hypothetical protein G7047_28090 [Diaphorobacter sp. HDW4A]|uniref:hypothetical protein n=1 Tax=Diaphorobacter sp. HDW4A TaxID=2714924 RepID=UPI0014096073|nr:hypothetical protein [Diaphorobacter sp. HDW4A]QIL83377.1 hypothetical protein G7047_28090 [Diaphorobacter sp. HDW4A]
MRSEVTVTLSPEQEFRFDLEGAEPLTNEEARRWLDAEFVRLDCEPLRPSGKVLLADKVLVVAANAGRTLLSDAAWSQQFARAARAALERETVRIDIPSMAVTF